MTPKELETGARAAGLGWDVWGALVVDSVAIDNRCNLQNCQSIAALANGAGLTIDQIMPSLLALAGDPSANPPVVPDRSLIDAHIATAKAIKSALTDLGIAWSTDGALTVWRPTARAVTEATLEYNGAPITTQDYFAQAALTAATIDDMAQALADFVGDPTAGLVEPPDPTLFYAIMGS